MNTPHSALCTLHQAQGTRHTALCTLHQAQGTRHSALCTLHQAQGTRHSALCTLRVILRDAPFVGTTLRIRIPNANDLSFGFSSISLNDAFDSFTIDWGDGTTQTFSALTRKVTHAYAASGDYTLRLSAGAYGVAVSSADEDAFRLQYAPMVLSYRSNALKYMEANALNGAINLTDVDVSDSPLTIIKTAAFANCSQLTHLGGRLSTVTTIRQNAYLNCSLVSGRVELPQVVTLLGTVDTSPFAGTHISEFHFAAANEEKVKSSTLYKASPDLGVSGATCHFDL